MTQKDLADYLGTTVDKIHAYENFKQQMPVDFAMAASEYFGCSLEYLLDRTDDRLPRDAREA